MSTTFHPEVADKKEIKPPNKLARLLAVAAFIWGILSIVVGFFGAASLLEGLALVLSGLAFLLPSAWWFYCVSEDRKAAARFQDTVTTNEELSKFLTEEDRLVLEGMSYVKVPERKRRHWPLTTSLSVVLFVLAVIIMPLPEGAEANTETPSTTPETPTTTQPTSTADTAADESRSSAASASSSAAEESRRSEEERIERERRENEERDRQKPVETAPQQQQNDQPIQLIPPPAPEPAPAPPQSAYYENCTAVWNATGGPIYAGQPGYAGHLDRDGDGVGCENDPR
ncbi:excalibur calcium-binding domain-containing protein [Corynebacterium genitalium ATCC 33030]|uniref:Excalibur domain protein n=1 Tax=Corynebacterium genitalium ATCC 33030 TaxID=585529 RepID=D7WAD3_9CORY|nr:excalibur calcium-binding domain-containing protein [Corynebacterium genitalium]EFK54814.1 excalibur domain protein [Corynebacterium genitalium ATCC 33030]UUA89884.1 excalibur calcium-binding domain-containing protein [Corynebacterium genitalium ATCC 33030]